MCKSKLCAQSWDLGLCVQMYMCVWYMYVHVKYTNACIWCT